MSATPVLESFIAAGRRAWPGVELAPEVVARGLAHLAADPAKLAGATGLNGADLYLAVGLALGDAAALGAFDTKLVPHVDAALSRMGVPASIVAAVKTAIRAELRAGVGGPGRPGGYAGRGELSTWVRTTATRRAIELMRGSTH